MSTLALAATTPRLTVPLPPSEKRPRHPSNISTSDAFNFASYCNGSAFDSIHTSPSGTKCFDSNQEFVGIMDFFVSGQSVWSEFRNMDSNANMCKVQFNSAPSLMITDFEFHQITTKAAHYDDDSFTLTNEWMVYVVDEAGVSQWVDSGVKLVDIPETQYVKNVMVACNDGATGNMGNVAISPGKGYWEYHLGNKGIPWENCGPDNQGVRPANLDADYGFYFTMDAMSGDWDAFWAEEFLGVHYFLETTETVPETQKCTSSENLLKVGSYYPFCLFILN